MCEDFWRRMALELNMLISGSKAPEDFVSRFYLLVEEVPVQTSAQLRGAFDDFHYHVANYEPDKNSRDAELGLIGEDELKRQASKFLTEIKKRSH